MTEPAELSVEEENRLKTARVLAKMRHAAQTFAEVFGLPGHETPHGKVILAVLDEFAETDKAIVSVERDDNGATDIPRTFIKIGRREVIDLIRNTILWKEHLNADSSGSTR